MVCRDVRNSCILGGSATHDIFFLEYITVIDYIINFYLSIHQSIFEVTKLSDNSANRVFEVNCCIISYCFDLNQGFNQIYNWSIPINDYFCNESLLQIGCAFL